MCAQYVHMHTLIFHVAHNAHSSQIFASKVFLDDMLSLLSSSRLKNDSIGVNIDRTINWCQMACGTENKGWCVTGTSNNFFHFIVQAVLLPVCKVVWQDWVTNIHKFLMVWLSSWTDQSYSDSRYYS